MSKLLVHTAKTVSLVLLCSEFRGYVGAMLGLCYYANIAPLNFLNTNCLTIKWARGLCYANNLC